MQMGKMCLLLFYQRCLHQPFQWLLPRVYMPAVWTCTIAKMPVYAYRYDNYRQDAGAKGLSKRGPSVGSVIMKMYVTLGKL